MQQIQRITDRKSGAINMSIGVLNIIQKLPLSIIERLRIERSYLAVIKHINKVLGRNKHYGNILYNPLVRSNRLYGNEYLLRCYAGIRDDLFAIIEHGLYFGNNTAKIPLLHEWELGCILTYGSYRQELLHQVYPDYYCEMIGPPILYADDDVSYQKKIKDNLQIVGKVLLFFPAHGLGYLTPRFAIESLAEQLILLANENNCTNIVVCTYMTGDDLCLAIQERTHEIKVCTYSCGNRFDQEFLIRQRALISLSAVTASNNLGTHIGNCVGLRKPHVLIKQSITYEGDTEREFGKETRSDNWKSQVEKEKELFERMFAPSNGKAKLTKEQYQLCDYYWGFSQKKTPEEIREIYQTCREYAFKHIGR